MNLSVETEPSDFDLRAIALQTAVDINQHNRQSGKTLLENAEAIFNWLREGTIAETVEPPSRPIRRVLSLEEPDDEIPL